ncbi:uncharacterized protein CEXT_109181 [Caerostris extrusa]|uniref:CWH43-like N-terminal domain-containing protein n=1 Tax=Caerostris extrusa TaxID=172846 RepID=A0AAV4UH42_CAEEX|nr:uncharacterized protein CEXT_109181 [Caerostris extrusa]
MHTEYKFIGGSWLPMLMSFTMLATIFLPYFIILVRGNLTPFLPFVSQVAGSPPQSGIFNLFLSISSLIAFIGLNLFYMGIRIQKKRLEDDWVRHTASLLNKISLVPERQTYGSESLLFPISWELCACSWEASFTASSSHTSWHCCIRRGRESLGIRIFLLSLITMCSALLGYSVRDGFSFDEDTLTTSCAIELEDVRYNLSYLISAVCEWSLLMAFIIFFMTLKEEGKDFSFTMCMTLREDTESTNPPKESEAVKKEENHNMGIADKTTEIVKGQS